MNENRDIILINKIVAFSPEKNTIYQTNSLVEGTPLNVPVSRCLALLLSRAGEVVSRQTFYSEVWEKQGLYVTDNTFYQNISLLRKTLRAAGIHENIIQTVPREGIRFTGTAETLIGQSKEGHSAEPEKSASSIADILPATSNELFNYSVMTRKTISVLALVSVVVASLFVLHSIPEQHDVFNSFSTVSLAQCQVHYYGALQEKDITDVLKSHNVECQNNNVIFIADNESHTRMTFTVCERYTQQFQTCHSYLNITGEPQ